MGMIAIDKRGYEIVTYPAILQSLYCLLINCVSHLVFNAPPPRLEVIGSEESTGMAVKDDKKVPTGIIGGQLHTSGLGQVQCCLI